MKEENKLTIEDQYFDATLRCLLGSEVELVKRGLKEKIDRVMLLKWIAQSLTPKTEEK